MGKWAVTIEANNSFLQLLPWREATQKTLEQNTIYIIQIGKASSRKALFSENFARSNSQNTELISNIDKFSKEQAPITAAEQDEAFIMLNTLQKNQAPSSRYLS